MSQIVLDKKIPVTEEEIKKIIQNTKEFRALDLIKKILLKDVITKEEVLEVAEFYGYKLTEKRMSKSRLSPETRDVLKNCDAMAKKGLNISTRSYSNFTGEQMGKKKRVSLSKRLKFLAGKGHLKKISQGRIRVGNKLVMITEYVIK